MVREISVPFLSHKRGVWNWKPSKAARRLGFKNVALGTDPVVAATKALKLWQQYRAKKAGDTYAGSFNHLRDHYKKTREYIRTSDETKRDYDRYIDVICDRWGPFQVSSLDPELVTELHGTYADRPYAGNQCLKVLSTLFTAAKLAPTTFPGVKGMANPCEDISHYGVKEGVEARERTWTDEEVTAFDAKAHPELLMARLLYSYTGQRTSDVLAMKDTDYKVEDGDSWLYVMQQKTGKRVWVYCHADLVSAVEAHIAMHREKRPDAIGATLLQDTKGQKFNRRSFVTRWDRTTVRAGIRAPKGKPPLGDEPRRHDLRRTAVTRLAEAGCTDDQISSITGLSRAMIQQQVYNVRSKAHSKAGIKKLEDYRR